MAIFRSLKNLIGKHPKRSRSFLTSLSFTSPTSQPPSPTPAAAFLFLSPQRHFPFRNRFLTHPLTQSRFLSPLSKLIIFPFHGPLFLSSPPWKLSQSATPLYIQGDVVLPAGIQALKLIQRTKARFPLTLGFRNKDDLKKDGGVVSEPNKYGDGLVDNFLNLPNLVSISRMVSGPVLGWMIINEWYLPAFAGLAISGATDWLDGYLARRMGINSVVGSYLDPLADKVLIGCVAIAMVENNLLHPGLVGLVVMRDVVLVGGAVYKRASDLGWQWKHWSDFVNLDGTSPVKVEPLLISKVNTVFQLLLVAAALLQPEFGTVETQPYITYLSWLVASTTLASTGGYGAQYMRSNLQETAVIYHLPVPESPASLNRAQHQWKERTIKCLLGGESRNRETGLYANVVVNPIEHVAS